MLNKSSKKNIIITKKQAKLLDTSAVTKNNILPEMLMEEASEKLFIQLQKNFNDLSTEKIAIIAGWGNNGGDSLALARKLFFLGIDFNLFIFENPPSKLNLLQLNILKSLGVTPLSIETFLKNNKKYTLIIDAIFGIGFVYREDSFIDSIFSAINSSGAKVASIDIPSGLSIENTPSVKADWTYSIGFIKDLFFLHNTRPMVGKIVNLNISFDISNIKSSPMFYINNFCPYTIQNIPQIDNFNHKYARGAVMCIGGSNGMYGSILFSAKSALNCGCGISLVLSQDDNIKSMNTIAPELIFDSIKNYNKYSSKYSAIVIGPGFSNASQSDIEQIKNIIKQDKQFILDASFFSLFDKSILTEFVNPPILTPHVGEFAIFFEKHSKTQQKLNKDNTIDIVKEAAKEYNCYILYKDSFMLCATPKNEVYIFDNPNYICAQAGSGDILSGLIAGILSQNNFTNESIVKSIYYAVSTFFTVCNYFSSKMQISYSTKEFIELIGRVTSIINRSNIINEKR